MNFIGLYGSSTKNAYNRKCINPQQNPNVNNVIKFKFTIADMILKGGPTQDEVLAVSLFKLDIKEGDIVADIGCGTGRVSIEASKKANKVIAIDRRNEAINCARKEIEKSGAENIELIEGEAGDILRTIEHLDGAFVGGSGELEVVLELLSKKVNGKIVVNAVLLDTVNRAVKTMKKLDIFQEIIHIQISRSYQLAGHIMLKPINPVYIIVGQVN